MIDTHVHFWRYNETDFPWIQGSLLPIQKDRTPEDFLKICGPDITGLIAVQARTLRAENTYLQSLADQYPIIKGITAWFDFEGNIQEQLDNRTRLTKGYRHLIQDEANPTVYLLEHPGLNTGMKAIQQAGLVYEVLIHQKDLGAANYFCQKHDKHLLVIDHLAKPDFSNDKAFDLWQQQIQALAKLEHVYLKISGLVTEAGPTSQASTFKKYIDFLFEQIGTQRLLWGSDWSVSEATHPYSSLLNHWQQLSAQCSVAEREQVQTHNPTLVYKINS